MEIHEKKDYIGLIESLRIKLGDFEELKDLNAIYPKVVKYLNIYILEMFRTLALPSFPSLLQLIHSFHSLHLLHLNFSQISSNFQVSLRIKVGFFNLSSCSSWICWRIVLLNMWILWCCVFCMNSCWFMFNWYELREKWKHDLGFVEEKQIGETEHPEHVVVLIFLVLMCLDLYFSDIFFLKLDFLGSDFSFWITWFELV